MDWFRELAKESPQVAIALVVGVTLVCLALCVVFAVDQVSMWWSQ